MENHHFKYYPSELKEDLNNFIEDEQLQYDPNSNTYNNNHKDLQDRSLSRFK